MGEAGLVIPEASFHSGSLWFEEEEEMGKEEKKEGGGGERIREMEEERI